MKIKFIILSVLVINQVSCQNKSKLEDIKPIEKNEIMKDESVIKILTKQIELGNDQGYGAFIDYNKEVLDASIAITNNILESNGFIKLNDAAFFNKIKNIFGRIINNSSETQYLKIDTYKDNICDKELKYYPYSVDAQFLYVVKKKNFITYFYPLPQIINYKKLYPELSKYESEDIIIEDKIENTKVRASQWKDIPDLDQQRKRNIQTLVARNMYLFNDNRAYFRWLVLNDEYFMRSLVTTFGYYDDKELNKWVADNTEFTNKNIEEVNKVLYNKKCDGKIKVNYPMLEHISEDEKKANEMYDFFKLDYFNWLQDDKNNLELTFSQKAEIIARLQSFIFSNKEEYRTYEYMGSFAEWYDGDNKFSKEFEKHNHYNIPNFKKQWQEAKEEGDGIARPGEE